MSLLFFNSDDDSDSASSDDGDSTSKTTATNKLDETTSRKRDSSSLLPPPLEALSTAKIPKFVTSHLHNDLDWDRMKKNAPVVEEKEFKIGSQLPPVTIKSTARGDPSRPDIALTKQVPQTLVATSKVQNKDDPTTVSGNRGGVVDHAIAWSKMYADNSEDGGVQKKTYRPNFGDAELNTFCYTDVGKDKVAYKKTHPTQQEASGKSGWKKLK